MPTPRLAVADLLESLSHHHVEFIVVGAVAAAMAGAELNTFDLHVVYRDSEEELDKWSRALRELEATYRDPAGRRLLPTRDRLGSLRVHLLDTRFGPLDLLREIGAHRGFEDLLPRSHLVRVRGQEVRILELAAVIATKEEAGRPKDLAALPLLREVLRRSLAG